MRFDGRTAVVTGAGQGLGRAYALLLANRGARVMVNDHADGGALAQTLADDITRAGGQALANGDSVASREGASRLVASAAQEFGRIDILVNNAGVVRDRAFHNLENEDIDAVLNVHLRGAFWVTQPVWRLMREQGYGRVVMTTSLSGLIGNFGQANYGAAKMGLVGLTRVLAAEGPAYGIHVNAIAPLADTGMAEKLTAFNVDSFSVESVAAVVGYLVHESCVLNGEVLSAVGGRVARYFIGLTQGFYETELTPESVAAHIGEVIERAGYSEPRELADEIDAVNARVQSAT